MQNASIGNTRNEVGKGFVSSSLALAAGLSLSAQTCTWTGAADGMWTNAANWAEKAVPGRYVAPDGTTSGSTGDVAVFGADGAGGATTIDLDGHLSVKTLRVTGGGDCPAYTFGTSTSQRLGIEANGYLVAAETATTPPPTMVAELGLWQQATANDQSATFSNNNSSAYFTCGRFGFATKVGTFNLNSMKLIFRTGNFCLNGDWVHGYDTERMNLTPADKATLQINGKIDRLMLISPDTAGTNHRIELGPNGVLDTRGAIKNALINTWRNLDIVGEGEIIFSQNYSSGKWSEDHNFYARYPHELGVRISAVARGETPPEGEYPGVWFYNEDSSESQCVSLTGENNVTGTLSFASGQTAGCPFSVASYGLKGVQSGLGWGSDVRLCDATRLIDRAAAESCDRTFRLRNKESGYTVAPCLDLRGAGPHVFDSDVVLENLSGSLDVRTVSGATATWNAKLTDTGDYALGLIKSGAGSLTLTNENTNTGGTTVRAGTLALTASAALAAGSALALSSGTALVFEDAPAAKTCAFSSLTVAGKATVTVGDRVTFSVDSFVQGTDGQLALVTSTPRSVIRCTGLAGGTVPSWITVDGVSAVVDADGTITSSTSRWKNPVSGELTEAANWTDGAPSAENPVEIRSADTTFDVHLTNTAATVGAWRVQNVNGCATVAVSNALTLASHVQGGTRFDEGSRLLVGENGSLSYSHGTVTETGSEDTTYKSLRPIIIHDGAEWCVDGGTVVLTNLLGRIQLGDGDADGTESCLRVKSGRFDLFPGGWYYGLELASNGTIRVEGGLLRFGTRGAEDTPLKMRGGKFLVSGDAQVHLIGGVDRGNNQREVSGAFSSGETVFSDRSVLNVQPAMHDYGYGEFVIAPWNAGETANVRFEDFASITSHVGKIDIGGGQQNSRVGRPRSNDQRSIFTYASATTSVGAFRQNQTGTMRYDVGIACTFHVGGAAGYGEFNLQDGGIYLGTYGVFCPYMGAYETDTLVPEGRINQSGGYFRIDAFAATSRAYNIKDMAGLLLGYATKRTSGSSLADRTYLGGCYLSGGKMEVTTGSLAVGAGYGTGRFVQTGGEFLLDTDTRTDTYDGDTAYRTNVCFGVVGMIGGTGEIILSNGTFSVNSQLYVGGVTTNKFFTRTGTSLSCANNGDRTDGTGTLTVAGGAFTCTHGVTVGAAGTGLLALEGSAGTFAAEYLVLSNNVASTVRFTPDENGATTVKLSGKLAIAPGARLVVDLTKSGRNGLDLFTYGSREGDFDDANIEIIDNPGTTHRFRKTATRYRLIRNAGCVLFVK